MRGSVHERKATGNQYRLQRLLVIHSRGKRKAPLLLAHPHKWAASQIPMLEAIGGVFDDVYDVAEVDDV